jgi:hypothetical protein
VLVGCQSLAIGPVRTEHHYPIRVGREDEAKRTRCVDIAAAKEAQLGGIPWGLEERLRDRERVVMEVSKGIMVLPEQTK